MKKINDVKGPEISKKTLTEENLYNFILRKEYKKNQETVFWTVFMAYMIFYFTRKQWTVFGSQLMEDGIITTSQYSIVGLILAIVYGLSKFINSPLSDRKSNRWLLGLGLIGAGIFNFLLGFSWINVSNILTPIILSSVLMVLIGWIHSLGAIPCVRFFYNWFDHKSRRNRNIIWNISHNIGSALSSFLIIGSFSLFSETFGWLGYFILPSVISIIFGIIVILIIKDRPEKAGLPSLQEYYNLKMIGEENQIVKNNEVDKPWKYYFIKYVLKNKFIWFLAVANMLMYTVRMGISDWGLNYLKKVHDFDIKNQGKWIYSMFDWGGVSTTLILGLLANKYLKKFAKFNMAMILIATLSLVGIWLLAKDSIVLLATFMLLAGVLYIPQCFLSVMANEFSHHKVISTSTGVLGVFGYFGDALMSKVIIGQWLINVGWTAVFIFLISCGLVAATMLIPMFNKHAAQ
ncbi:MAG: MFS transporter [Spiroplasma sp.]|nr:MFS transporter [Spiroplasma sp.]